jgi:hypothetical protein
MMKQSAASRGSWRIGELAGSTDVSTDTLRHYERKGTELTAGWQWLSRVSSRRAGTSADDQTSPRRRLHVGRA